MTATTIAVADLLRHAGWVHALARALARDEHRAADLAQQAWVAVLERPPTHAANVRGFLGTVLRNLWRPHLRAEARRCRRERAAEDPSVHESSAVDVVARAAAQRSVVDAVLSLDEPYRGTVLLRFFDGWSVRRIAEHQRVPVATVRTRLQRALRRLRERLRQQSERGLATFTLPFLTRSHSWFLLPLLAMKTKLILGIGAAAALGLLFAVQYLPETGANAQPEPGVTGRPPALAGSRGSGNAVATAPGERRLVPPPSAAASEPVRATPVVVTGSLRTSEDLPLAGRRVAFVTRTARTSLATDPESAFAFPVERDDGRIEIDEAGWTTVLTALVSAAAPPRHALVIAAPAVRIAGQVVDEHGGPVPQAALSVVLPDGFRARFRANADAAASLEWRTTGDGNGLFELSAVPAVAAATLLTSHPSFLPDRRELPPNGDPALRVILRRPGAADGALLGQVIDSGGSVVPAAWVASGERAARADEQGNFALPGGGGSDLLAVKRGLGPVRLARPEGGWPPFLLVQLGAAPFRISGRVLDGAGQGVAGARVWVTDATPFGGNGGDGADRAVAEGLATGGATREEIMARLRAPGAAVDATEVLRNTSLSIWPWVRTAVDGSFTLDGLLDRAYDLRAMRDDNLLWTDQAGVAAGSSGVELRLPADGTFAAITGRVVTAAGAPVPNVRIAPMCDAVRVRTSTMHEQGTAVRTDADGRFRLVDVPKHTAYLRLDGERILPLEFGRGVAGGLFELTAGNVTDVAITVRQRLHVQVELSEPTAADGLEVYDRDGQQLMIDVFQGGSRNTVDRLPFVAEGRTPVFVVPDTAATLVLKLGEREVRREALALAAADVNRLRF